MIRQLGGDGGGVPPHAPTHSRGGSDPVTVENLATGSSNTTYVLSPDGAGGLVMRPEMGSRVVLNPNANFGSPPSFTYTLSADEAVVFADFDPSATDLTVNLPPISGLNPGQMVGLLFPLGNPNVTVTINPDPVDDIVAPDGTSPGPGSPLVFTPGTLPAGARLYWEGMGAGGPFTNNIWMMRYDSGTLGGGGGASDWATVLAVGNVSGGSDAVLSTDDRLVTVQQDYAGSILHRAYVTGRSTEQLSSGSIAFFDVGTSFYTADPASGLGSVLVRIDGLGGSLFGGGPAFDVDDFTIHIAMDPFTGAIKKTYVLDGMAAFDTAAPGYTEVYVPAPGQLRLRVRDTLDPTDILHVAANIRVTAMEGPIP